jgi:hypothetical protein
VELSTATLEALGQARTELIAEIDGLTGDSRWASPSYKLLTKLEAFMAEYFEPESRCNAPAIVSSSAAGGWYQGPEILNVEPSDAVMQCTLDAGHDGQHYVKGPDGREFRYGP